MYYLRNVTTVMTLFSGAVAKPQGSMVFQTNYIKYKNTLCNSLLTKTTISVLPKKDYRHI